ncbi:MAG: LamG domain-containing protein [Planctomycetota bacterium]|jgi:hypothetical protein
MNTSGDMENLLRRFYRQKKSAIRTNEQMDREIVDYSLEAYVEARKKSFAARVPKQRKMILKSPAIRVGAAALIVFVVLFMIIFSGTDDQPKQISEETTVVKTPQDDKPVLPGPSTKSPPLQKRDFDFEDIDLMLAAGNVDGVVAMVSGADFKTKVSVANYLSKMDQLEALLALVKLSEGDHRNYPSNPFALAIEELKDRIEMMADQSDGQDETFETNDLSPDVVSPNLATMPEVAIVIEPEVDTPSQEPPEDRIAETVTSVRRAGPTLTEGISGSAYYFDGEDDYVNCGNGESLDCDSSFTAGAWIKLSQSKGYGTILTKGSPYGQNYGLYVEQVTGFIRIEFTNGGVHTPDETFIDSNTNVLDSSWHHVVGTFDGAVMRIYIDGKLENSGIPTTLNPDTNNKALTIGYRNDRLGNYYFGGTIDDVMIYDRALPFGEIQTLYQRRGNLSGTESGLLGYWNFDNDEGEIVKDLGPYGNHGGLSNTRPELTQGASGKGYYFDGHGDYIEIGQIEGLGVEQTRMLWVYPEILLSEKGIYLINEDGNQSSNNWIELYDSDGNGLPEIRAGFDAWNYLDSAGEIIETGHWYHIAVVSTVAGDVEIYINGVMDSNGSDFSATTMPKGILIGAGPQSKITCLPGVIDEVAIFNRALSGDEILQIYQNDGRLRGYESGLVGYWNFDYDDGDVVKDISPNGNHGKLGGW